MFNADSDHSSEYKTHYICLLYYSWKKSKAQINFSNIYLTHGKEVCSDCAKCQLLKESSFKLVSFNDCSTKVALVLVLVVHIIANCTGEYVVDAAGGDAFLVLLPILFGSITPVYAPIGSSEEHLPSF